jgi:hypothetical protein
MGVVSREMGLPPSCIARAWNRGQRHCQFKLPFRLQMLVLICVTERNVFDSILLGPSITGGLFNLQFADFPIIKQFLRYVL